jgi:PiT family inorganic phosphate transporter
MIDLTFFLFLSSGLFLGWSLGANDAANIFGTAVTTRMLRFRTAAILGAVFVVLGAVVSGAGASHGLGKLGAVNALAGSFTVALSAALTVFTMTKWGLPVSTTQAVVGGIIGWNFFSDSPTDLASLSQIAGTWIASPILGALFAWLIYRGLNFLIEILKPHLLWLDHWTRLGLVLAGIFGAYSLGANNIGNVMGVFVPASPLQDMHVGELFSLTAPQRLFLWGGIAIAVGVFFSLPVMATVGKGIVPIGPLGGWVVVVSQALVLFIFSSSSLQTFVTDLGLPPIPLVPVSSSQAVVGAVCGIAFARGIKGMRQIRWREIAKIAAGWISTPISAALICFVLLFIVQNVFEQQVYVSSSPSHVQSNLQSVF